MKGRILPKRGQRGLTTVEFAVVAAVLLLAIFTVIEFGRLYWTMETLVEATRRGARVAAVCPVNHAAVANVTVLNEPADSGASAILNGLSTDQVSVSYLDQAGSAVADPLNDWCEIQYVRVRITGYVHNFAVPLVGSFVDAPEFETTLPAESLGLVPGVGFQCFGVASPTPACT